MPKLYLANQYYQVMPAQTQKVPRDRFVQYYNDLFDLEGLTRPPLSVYLTEGQYDFSTLGEAVLKLAHVKEDFSKLDLFVVAYWSHEFDPNGSFGAYFSHQYGISSTLFDVCDQGILSSIVAIKLIMAYAKLGKIKNAALLCFDQRSIPVEVSFSGKLPVKSSARLLFFSTEKKETSRYQLLNADVSQHQQKITHQENAALRTITIESDSPYYSSAELFSPLFDQTILNPLFSEVHLKVMDVESDWEGSILFKRIS
jgi:hypothetical protein